MRRTLADLVRCPSEMGATRDIAGAIAAEKDGSKQENQGFNGSFSVNSANDVSRTISDRKAFA
jgi:hypothetical protein